MCQPLSFIYLKYKNDCFKLLFEMHLAFNVYNMGLVRPGSLLKNKAAFPFTKKMAILWKRCLIFSASFSPVCLSRATPNFFNCSTVDSSHCPKVSNTMGTMAMPLSVHPSPCLVIFSLNLSMRADPALLITQAWSQSWR